MNTILFTWNPRKWRWDDFQRAVVEANVEGRYVNTWSCGVTRNIATGDRAFLMRLGVEPKGIMASGVVLTEPEESLHWDPDRAEQGDTGFYVKILFDVLSDTPILGKEALSSPPLSEHNWYPQASGTFIPENIAQKLESIWTKSTGTRFIPPTETEMPTLYLEGTKRTKLVASCERNPEARGDCIQHYGAQCQVCGLVFDELYGPIGKGFIQAHHLVPMSEIGKEYEVNPVRDLRPVCPNCHAMLHKRTPPFAIDELKGMMRVLK
jgi:5-methylcytosine-specific restriction protein A